MKRNGRYITIFDDTTSRRPKHKPVHAVGRRRTQKPLVWLLNFAQRTDLELLDEEKLKEVREELRAFCAVQHGGDPAATPLSAIEISSLAYTVRHYLDSLWRGDEWKSYAFGNITRSARRQDDGIVAIRYSGDFKILWPWLANELIINQHSNIARCERDDCQRFYLVVKRQKYCSQRCANHVRVRKWRNKLTAEKRKKISRLQHARGLERKGRIKTARHYRLRHDLGEVNAKNS
jgi:hypothetical protein